ncbi:MAG TPA: hypothetical protein VI524_11855 [Anaerolineales bacterium]|nr:hypothetical protein [Anaerolineales bacterium]
MNHIIPPHEPKPPEPVHPPMIYVKEPLKWEYKQIACDLEKEGPLSESELNALGAEGWELAGVVQQPPVAYFYFKRLVER